MEFDFDGSYGTYHSNYDTRWYTERFVDPGFKVGATLTQVLGLSAMRLASADVLPLRYSYYASKIQDFLRTAEKWGVDGDGRRVADVDLSRAKQIASDIERQARVLEQRVDRELQAGTLSPDARAAMNDRLARLEQTLLDESEPADKRWYRHVIYGWNIYSLYEGQPLPGLAEAIRVRDAALVRKEIARIETALQRMVDVLSILQASPIVVD
jgi:N-acetylated-alpha-linked acidic dipeptidase